MALHRMVSIWTTGLLLAGALGSLGACESGRVGSGGQPLPAPRTAEPSAAEPPAAPHTAKSARPKGAQPAYLELEGGGRLRLPAGAEVVRRPPRLPGMVKQAKTFSLPGGAQRLMVSELDLEGQSCEARIEAEWKRMQANKRDGDAERLKVRRITAIEDRAVAGRRVLYSESMQGTTMSDAGKPFAAVASVMTCAHRSLVLLMYVSSDPKLASSVRAMLDAIVSSYQKPA